MSKHLRATSALFLASLLYLCSTAAAVAQADTLRVGIKPAPPFIMKNDAGQWEGLSIYLWEEVSKELGVDTEYVVYQTADDLIVALADSLIDISINPLTVSSGRLREVGFTQPFFISGLGVAIHKSTLSGVMSIIRNIFSFDFFKAVGAVFLVILSFGLLVWLAERQQNPEHFRKGVAGLWDGIWWSAVTMTTVGYGDKAPTTVIGKMVSLIWMFAAIILISSLTAGIASALTVNSLASDIETIYDLKGKQNGSLEGSFGYDFLRDKGLNVAPYNDFSQAFDALSEEQITTFIYDTPILKYQVNESDHAADIMVLPISLKVDYYAFAYRKSLPISDQIDPILVDVIKRPGWNAKIERYSP